MPMTIVTHPGTGTEIVAGVLRRHGARLRRIEHVADAHTARFDGLVLLGGADILPTWYGEPNRNAGRPDRKRDLVEWTLVRRAFTEQKPVLGICRGHQMLAVAAGGSLYQDIWSEAHPGVGRHSCSSHRLVRVIPALRDRLPTLTVNSLHHQAVKCVPPAFVVAAASEDGVIEAIYRPGLLGVQWHPELLYPRDERWEGLFAWLVEGLQP